MARRQLTIGEIAEYRATQRDQLKRTLLAGGDTRTIRRALADLDEQEAEAHAIAAQKQEEQAQEVSAQACEMAAVIRRRIAATMNALQPPGMPA